MSEMQHQANVEQVQPENLPAEAEKTGEEFTPSPRWKRVFAWVLFAIVVIGIICCLFYIAVPEWPELVRDYFRN